MRKDIYEYVKELQKEGAKINYAQVAEVFNCDYRTVKRYAENPYTKPVRAPKPSKLDEYREIIIEKLDRHCTRYSIYEFIKELGYTGHYTILADFCRKYVQDQTKKATIRFETNPGLQAQVDWKEEMTLHTRDGEPITFNIFLMLLGFSRKKYIELTLDRSQDTLMGAMLRGFSEFGGVPKEIIFDNMRTVVDQSKTQYRNAHINDRFYQFSKDVGFEVWTCRPYRPQTKGKVEALARTMERLRPFDGEFNTIEELEEIIRRLKVELNSSVSQATGQIPDVLLKKEKEYLHKLPGKDVLETYLTIPLTRKVSKESMIVYNKRKYSLPTYYIGKSVEIKEENGKILILYNGIKVETHEISEKPFNYKYEHVKEILATDAMKHKDILEIEQVARNNMDLYDKLGG